MNHRNAKGSIQNAFPEQSGRDGDKAPGWSSRHPCPHPCQTVLTIDLQLLVSKGTVGLGY